jgi:hypothetical protein
VNVVDVDRIFACYRTKLEETDCRLTENQSCAAYFILLSKTNHYFITIVTVCWDRSVHLSSVSNFEPTKNCAVLGFYAASNCNFSPKFREDLSVPSSGSKNIGP